MHNLSDKLILICLGLFVEEMFTFKHFMLRDFRGKPQKMPCSTFEGKG